MWRFVATSFEFTKNWKQVSCPVGAHVQIHTMEYYSAMKRNERSGHTMDSALQSERRNQSEKDYALYDFIYMVLEKNLRE